MFTLDHIPHVISITDDNIIEQCGSILREIDSLMDVRYCPSGNNQISARTLEITRFNVLQQMILRFDTLTFDWNPNYLRQFHYIDSLTFDNIGILDLGGVEYLNDLPDIGSLTMKNFPLSTIPNEWLSTNKIHTLEISNTSLLLDFPINITLTTLRLDNCNLMYIDTIHNLMAVEYLDLSNNYITDVVDLSAGRYKTISLQGNNITDVNALATCINLESLNIADNPIGVYEELIKLPKLKRLFISFDQIDTIYIPHVDIIPIDV